MSKKTRIWIIAVVASILSLIGIYFIPFVHDRLSWRLEDLQTSIYYFFNPPEEVVFLPTQQNLVTRTPRPTMTSTPSVETALFTPTITPTSIPSSVILQNVTFIDQMHRWNYCGPANLAMALEYVGWEGFSGNSMDLRDQIGSVVKPGIDDPSLDFIQRSQTDVNVMPYEMVDFVNDNTPFRALYRYGGTIDLLKQLIAAGFPVITEKGIYQTLPPENTLQWAGHYAFTTGYDELSGELIYQDSYTPNDNISYERQGKNVRTSYSEYLAGWRAFNYVFIVVYSPGREVELYDVLNQWADEAWSFRNALELSNQDIDTAEGIDEYFAWFNQGTSYGLLTEYGLAAQAYDTAFGIYNALPVDDRPFRIMWYQTGPYRAYFFTSRYQDVINLADATESTLYYHRVLEETLYWRARAKAALGYYESAYEDIRRAVIYNPNFFPGINLMAEWGISP